MGRMVVGVPSFPLTAFHCGVTRAVADSRQTVTGAVADLLIPGAHLLCCVLGLSSAASRLASVAVKEAAALLQG